MLTYSTFVRRLFLLTNWFRICVDCSILCTGDTTANSFEESCPLLRYFSRMFSGVSPPRLYTLEVFADRMPWRSPDHLSWIPRSRPAPHSFWPLMLLLSLSLELLLLRQPRSPSHFSPHSLEELIIMWFTWSAHDCHHCHLSAHHVPETGYWPSPLSRFSDDCSRLSSLSLTM